MKQKFHTDHDIAKCPNEQYTVTRSKKSSSSHTRKIYRALNTPVKHSFCLSPQLEAGAEIHAAAIGTIYSSGLQLLTAIKSQWPGGLVHLTLIASDPLWLQGVRHRVTASLKMTQGSLLCSKSASTMGSKSHIKAFRQLPIIIKVPLWSWHTT